MEYQGGGLVGAEAAGSDSDSPEVPLQRLLLLRGRGSSKRLRQPETCQRGRGGTGARWLACLARLFCTQCEHLHLVFQWLAVGALCALGLTDSAHQVAREVAVAQVKQVILYEGKKCWREVLTPSASSTHHNLAITAGGVDIVALASQQILIEIVVVHGRQLVGIECRLCGPFCGGGG